jgi:mitochondrial fission protein ELM1
MTGRIAWAVTTGAVGMRTQARGLAEAVADTVVEKTVGIRFPWSLLPGAWAPSPGTLIDPDPELDQLEPPWPDVIVTCGRKSAAAGVAVRRASGGKTLAVHVQDPLTDPKAFDLIVAMPHDRASAPNVLKVPTALHDFTPAKMSAAADAWRQRFTPLGHPLIGVVLGGSTRNYPFDAASGERLIGLLQGVKHATGAGLAITPSPRTPSHIVEAFAAAFADDPRVYLWDREGPNPYHGILALSDRIVVTSDSVSMMSEAVASPHPVEVFDLEGERHAPILDRLIDEGLVARFDGANEPARTKGPLNSTTVAAEAVKKLLDARKR